MSVSVLLQYCARAWLLPRIASPANGTLGMHLCRHTEGENPCHILLSCFSAHELSLCISTA